MVVCLVVVRTVIPGVGSLSLTVSWLTGSSREKLIALFNLINCSKMLHNKSEHKTPYPSLVL